MAQSIPIYTINQFKKDPVKEKLYQVELFDKNRNFKVEYPHRHDNFFEILLISKGSGYYTIDFEKYPMAPGYMFFVSPGQVHSITFSEDISGYIFLFTSEFFHLKNPEKKLSHFPFFQSQGNNKPLLFLKNTYAIQVLFQLACKEAEDGNENEEIVHSILALLLQLAKKDYPASKQENTRKKGYLLVKKFRELVEQNFSNMHSVKEYANLLAVSANHLNETVKQITGKTAKEQILNRILLESKRLLVHTDLNISEIAYTLNFEDQSYFSRLFKKNYQLSPKDFRQKRSKSF